MMMMMMMMMIMMIMMMMMIEETLSYGLGTNPMQTLIGRSTLNNVGLWVNAQVHVLVKVSLHEDTYI